MAAARALGCARGPPLVRSARQGGRTPCPFRYSKPRAFSAAAALFVDLPEPSRDTGQEAVGAGFIFFAPGTPFSVPKDTHAQVWPLQNAPAGLSHCASMLGTQPLGGAGWLPSPLVLGIRARYRAPRHRLRCPRAGEGGAGRNSWGVTLAVNRAFSLRAGGRGFHRGPTPPKKKVFKRTVQRTHAPSPGG